ncbi:MAG: protease modulator HflC [Thermodesulfobacteriota bacterium]
MIKYLVVAIFVIVVAIQTVFVIPEWEQAVVLQFGKPVQIIKDPGLYFRLPFVQDVVHLEKRILVAEAQPAEYITLDKKRLIVDSVSRWQIADPLVFYQKVQTYSGGIARLNDIIFGRLRQEIANHNFKEFIREEREKIMTAVTVETAQAAKAFGISVVDVRIRRVDLPNEVQKSVFKRMNAERERIAKRYRAEGEEQVERIRGEADKEKEIILAEAYRKSQTLRGEGDADATAIYAAAFTRDEEFYSFTRHLSVYEKILGHDATILLRPDSELMRFLDTWEPDKKKQAPSSR